MNINPKVVDLSHHNSGPLHGDIDFARVHAAGIRGVVNKATESVGFVDPTFAARRNLATSAGLLFGGYFFLRPGDTVAQSDHFLAAVGSIEGLLLAVDYEDRLVPLARRMASPVAGVPGLRAAIARIEEKTGRLPVVYGGAVLKEHLGATHDPLLARCRLWLSQYGPHPVWPPCWSAPWLWQFTGDGVGPTPHAIDGITGAGIDIDSFAGTDDELSQQWAT